MRGLLKSFWQSLEICVCFLLVFFSVWCRCKSGVAVCCSAIRRVFRSALGNLGRSKKSKKNKSVNRSWDKQSKRDNVLPKWALRTRLTTCSSTCVALKHNINSLHDLGIVWALFAKEPCCSVLQCVAVCCSVLPAQPSPARSHAGNQKMGAYILPDSASAVRYQGILRSESAVCTVYFPVIILLILHVNVHKTHLKRQKNTLYFRPSQAHVHRPRAHQTPFPLIS